MFEGLVNVSKLNDKLVQRACYASLVRSLAPTHCDLVHQLLPFFAQVVSARVLSHHIEDCLT